ncbi:MAG: hypothetical protein L0I24_11510 [Pseudonocardia sp.]|nr:hypothetical protein [Pseudonocardia sp.]MDN5931672.1 hypothetical protein [Pseudonocardia sp.]
MNASLPPSASRDLAEIRSLLVQVLAPAQRGGARLDRLTRVAATELAADERLQLLYPCRIVRTVAHDDAPPLGPSRYAPARHGALLVTDQAVVLGALTGDRLVGVRRPRADVTNVPLEFTRFLHVPTARMWIKWRDGGVWHCRSLRRAQAQHVADLLRPGSCSRR